jgi:hypothetical protein
VLQGKHHQHVTDAPYGSHTFAKTMSDFEEFIVLELRKTFLLSLDDLLVITREFIINKNASRSALNRCLRRHGVGNLKT